MNNGQTSDIFVNKKEGDAPSPNGIPIFRWIIAAVWAASERSVQTTERQDHK